LFYRGGNEKITPLACYPSPIERLYSADADPWTRFNSDRQPFGHMDARAIRIADIDHPPAHRHTDPDDHQPAGNADDQVAAANADAMKDVAVNPFLIVVAVLSHRSKEFGLGELDQR